MVDLGTKPRGLFVKPSGEVVVRHVGGAFTTMPVGTYRYEPPEDELPVANDKADYDRVMSRKND